jgi:hypothetical protein
MHNVPFWKAMCDWFFDYNTPTSKLAISDHAMIEYFVWYLWAYM